MWIVILQKDNFDDQGPQFESVIEFETEKAAMDWATEITEACEWASCVITSSTLPFEIFWHKYRHMREVRRILKERVDRTLDEALKVWHFSHPYVCVIHEKSGNGYYLDRSYNYICSVENIIRPGDPTNEDYVPDTLKRVIEHETETEHQAASFTTPKWAEELPPSEFTTYWLY